MNFYLLKLLGKWISLAFVAFCPVVGKDTTSVVQNENLNLDKDSSVVATVVKYTTVTKNDPTLEAGKTKIEKKGENGLVYETNSGSITIQTMSSEVILKGTKQTTSTKTNDETVKKVVYDNLTMDELIVKLDKNLKSTLSGTGKYYAKYSIEYGVDPYLALAISLHETGCSTSCSNIVKTKNNVGGMMGSNGVLSFATLEEGIQKFIKNLKSNYYDYGLTTPELINSKYASSTTWASKVNKYIEKIKAS
jgi:hypothetical protein